MKMNEREKKLEKKDSWGYIINIIYEITTSNALLNVPENGESGYTGRQYLLSNPLIFCAYQKIFKPLYCGIINILSGSIWMDFLGTHSQLIMNLFILHTGIHKITPPQTF